MDEYEDESEEAILKCMGKGGACRNVATVIFEDRWFCEACSPTKKTSEQEPGEEWAEFLKRP